MTSGQRYQLVLEALPGDVDADARIKRLLKYALRSLRLRCRSASQVAEQPRSATTAREKILAALTTLEGDEIEVLASVADGLVCGRSAYGVLNVCTDGRAFDREALEEVRDALVYCGAALVRAGRARSLSVVERARAAAAELKAAHSAAQTADEREEVARAIASVSGGGMSLTELALEGTDHG